MSLLLSNFYPTPVTGIVYTTGNQNIDGSKNFLLRPTVRNSGVLLQGEQTSLPTTIVYTTGNQNIDGSKNFLLRPTVRNSGVLLQGEQTSLPTTIVYTTGNQTISGIKNFSSRPTFNQIGLATTGDLIGLEFEVSGLIEILDNGIVYTSGTQTISGNKNFTLRPTVNGTGVLLSGEAVGGGGGGLDPFDGNRAIKRIPSLSDIQPYGGTTISGFLENMFFPFISGLVTLNSFPIFTYGINSLLSINFTGSITLNDNTITGIAFMSGNNIISGPTQRLIGGAYNSLISLLPGLNSSTNSVYRTRIFVQRNNESSIIDSSPLRNIRFEPRYYYGVSANPNLGTGIITLTPSNPATYTYDFGSRPSSVTHSNFQPNNQYIYFAYPSPDSTQEGIINWGNILTSIFETNTSFEYITSYQQLNPVTINFAPTNKNLQYRIYRSNNLLTLLPLQSFTLRFTFGG